MHHLMMHNDDDDDEETNKNDANKIQWNIDNKSRNPIAIIFAFSPIAVINYNCYNRKRSNRTQIPKKK